MRVQDEANFRKSTRPKKPVFIIDRGAQFNPTGSFLDRSVEEGQFSFTGFCGFIGKANLHTQSLAGHVALHFRKVALGNRKIAINRIQPLNYQKRTVARRDHVAEIDEALSGTAIDGRTYGAV